jgi:hypothetical protein
MEFYGWLQILRTKLQPQASGKEVSRTFKTPIKLKDNIRKKAATHILY